MVKAISAKRLNRTFGGKFSWPNWNFLTRRGLEWYSEFIPDEEDSYDECVAAVDDHGRYVSVLVGQCNNEEQQAVSNE